MASADSSLEGPRPSVVLVAAPRESETAREVESSLPEGAVAVVEAASVAAIRNALARSPVELVVFDARCELDLETLQAALGERGEGLPVVALVPGEDPEELREYEASGILRAVPCGARRELGEVLGLLLSLRRGWRLASQRLGVAERLEALGQMVGGVAHDFNNVLTILLGSLELASEDAPAETPLHQEVHRALECAELAAEMIDQLMDFARCRSLPNQVLDVNEVLQGIRKLVARVLPENIDLRLKLAPSLPSVVAEAGALQSVVINLVWNARDALSEGGHVVVETEVVEIDEDQLPEHPGLGTGKYVRLSVEDDGAGMPPEVQGRVFEPFFTTKPRGGGTGLGLPSCYGIVRQFGGGIWLYSEPGQGTTVRVYLPADGREISSGREPSTPRSAHEGSGATILVTEDEGELRAVIERMLTGAGYEVLTAPNGEGALEILKAEGERIDILVTDLVMPGMDGIALSGAAEKVRPGLRTVFMSGYSRDLVDGRRSLPTEAHFLTKPFRKASLLELVASILQGKRLTPAAGALAPGLGGPA